MKTFVLIMPLLFIKKYFTKVINSYSLNYKKSIYPLKLDCMSNICMYVK